MENTYRMTDRDIRLMIQLRAANADVFTGRKNSAMTGWRAIRKEMGIPGALTAQQLKKKWDNLKDKYRALKNPPAGLETPTSSWRWFQLMDAAMSGAPPPSEDAAAAMALLLPKAEGCFSDPRLGGGALPDVLELSGMEAESRTGSPVQVSDGDHASPQRTEGGPARSESRTAALFATSLPDGAFGSHETAPPPSSSSCVREDGAAGRRLEELQREWNALQGEQAELDRELLALQRDRELLSRDTDALEREREVLQRERGVLERERGVLERDRVVLERDRVVLDRDRAFLDRDRAFLDRDRVFLERAREDLERERALLRREREGPAGDHRTERTERTERTTEKEVVLQTRFYQRLMEQDPDQLETRQRLVGLFQKLVEKL